MEIQPFSFELFNQFPYINILGNSKTGKSYLIKKICDYYNIPDNLIIFSHQLDYYKSMYPNNKKIYNKYSYVVFWPLISDTTNKKIIIFDNFPVPNNLQDLIYWRVLYNSIIIICQNNLELPANSFFYSDPCDYLFLLEFSNLRAVYNLFGTARYKNFELFQKIYNKITRNFNSMVLSLPSKKTDNFNTYWYNSQQDLLKLDNIIIEDTCEKIEEKRKISYEYFWDGSSDEIAMSINNHEEVNQNNPEKNNSENQQDSEKNNSVNQEESEQLDTKNLEIRKYILNLNFTNNNPVELTLNFN